METILILSIVLLIVMGLAMLVNSINKLKNDETKILLQSILTVDLPEYEAADTLKKIDLLTGSIKALMQRAITLRAIAKAIEGSDSDAVSRGKLLKAVMEMKAENERRHCNAWQPIGDGKDLPRDGSRFLMGCQGIGTGPVFMVAYLPPKDKFKMFPGGEILQSTLFAFATHWAQIPKITEE